MTDKGFNLFDECAARCVHLSLQEEECTSSSWGASKMYTSGSTANSQKMLTEINESSIIAKIRIWVKSDTVNHLKTFRIFSREMQILLLILDLSWWFFSCLHIQTIFLLSYELKMLFQIFVAKVYRSVVLKNNGLRTVDIIFTNKLQISWRICFNILTKSEEWQRS